MDLNKVCYCLISGASKGIGKRIAIETSKILKPGSLMVLFARSSEGLKSTKDEILSVSNGIDVVIYAESVATLTTDDFQQRIEKSFTANGKHEKKNFELSLIVHNVGSVGDITKTAKEINDYKTWQEYYQLNIFSIAALNSAFLSTFSSTNAQILIVNISSKCALVPFKSCTLYCSGKAARDMYFSVLAAEENENSNLKVLNYAPGPVDTDMFTEVQTLSCDSEIRESFKKLTEIKTVLQPQQTVLKLLLILKENKYKSGDHIDYYDSV